MREGIFLGCSFSVFIYLLSCLSTPLVSLLSTLKFRSLSTHLRGLSMDDIDKENLICAILNNPGLNGSSNLI